MIVVEGPDGSGKTTLIEKIKARTGLQVAPRVVSKDAEAMVDLKKWTEKNVSDGWQPVIFDRHRLISEPIYGPILRETPEPGFDDQEWFFKQLAAFYALEPFIIYCLPPLKVVWENVKFDADNRVVGQEPITRAIYGAYFNKAHTEQVLYKHSFMYDYTEPALAAMQENYFCARINELAKAWRLRPYV